MTEGDSSEGLILKRLETIKAAKVTAANFCVYQERTQQEVFDRLKKMKLSDDEADEIICDLIQDNFINEERFAKVFASGKFRLKRWGRKKIFHHLKQRGLSEYCISKGLEEIDDKSYLNTIDKLIEAKDNSINKGNDFERKGKITNYLVGKGFEIDLCRERLEVYLEDRSRKNL
jgi:regulatory protein